MQVAGDRTPHRRPGRVPPTGADVTVCTLRVGVLGVYVPRGLGKGVRMISLGWIAVWKLAPPCPVVESVSQSQRQGEASPLAGPCPGDTALPPTPEQAQHARRTRRGPLSICGPGSSVVSLVPPFHLVHNPEATQSRNLGEEISLLRFERAGPGNVPRAFRLGLRHRATWLAIHGKDRGEMTGQNGPPSTLHPLFRGARAGSEAVQASALSSSA